MEEPVLAAELSSAVVVESLEVIEKDGFYFVRARSTGGAEGIAVTTDRIRYLYPIFEQLVAPVFVGRDARDLESLVDEAYLAKGNYKLSGLALWCCVAWAELSLLDLLGKAAGKPVGELLGGVLRSEIPIYVASGRRDTSPQEEVEILLRGIEATGARAVKFKVGGRMSHDADSIPGRTEGLIRLSRKVLGDEIAILADANGSYTASKAVEIGRMLEEIGALFFEEPCPFDQLDETKRVADALDIPVAGGEQESSFHRFAWMIENGAVQVVQPDAQYHGGLIRTARVARLAQKAGLPTTLHVSGEPGFIYTLHFASRTPNIGPFQEFKGIKRLSRFFDPPLEAKDGKVAVPTAPGLGMIDMGTFLKGAKPVR